MKTQRRNPRPLLPRLLALAATLLLAAPAAAGAEGIAPVEGPWGARSTDALPVSFEVKGGEIVNARFSFTWGFCGSFESALPNEEAIGTDGSWSFLDSRGPKIEATFVAPDRAEGTVTAPSRELPGCPKTVATFVAVPGPVPPAPPIRIADGRGHLARRPSRIELRGAQVRYIHDLHWTLIDLEEAHAKGTAVLKVGGRTLTLRVGIRLACPIDRDGYRTYRKLTYTVIGKHLPRGVHRWGESPLG